MMKMNFIQRPRRTILDIPLAGFLVVFVASTIFSSDKPASFFGWHGRPYEGLLALLAFLLISRIIFEAVTLPRSIPFLETGWKRWFIFSLPLVVFVFFFFSGGSLQQSFFGDIDIAWNTLFEN